MIYEITPDVKDGWMMLGHQNGLVTEADSAMREAVRSAMGDLTAPCRAICAM